MSKKNIGVIFGGVSSEHEVSKLSAKTVLSNIDYEKFNVYPIFITKDGEWRFFEGNLEDVASENPEVFSKSKAIISPDRKDRGILKITEDNKIEKNAEFDDAFYKQAKDASKVLNQKEEDFKKTGLQASKQPKDAFKKKDMYENKMQTVRFKRTSFLTEEHMMSKIPDEMKVEGKRFKMVDMNENTYICEWVKNQYNGKESATILENRNPKKLDESIEKMKRLYSFNVGEKTTTTTTQNRLYENNEGFTSTLNNIRKLIK